jgi:hypothetical protein
MANQIALRWTQGPARHVLGAQLVATDAGDRVTISFANDEAGAERAGRVLGLFLAPADDPTATAVAVGDSLFSPGAGSTLGVVVPSSYTRDLPGGEYVWEVWDTRTGLEELLAYGTWLLSQSPAWNPAAPPLTLGWSGLTDPGADRILFWDDSAGIVTWLQLGTNLSITGTTLNAAGGGGGVSLPIAESDVTGLVADLAAKAPLASPALTGTPTAPTAAANTNTTQLATTAFVTAAVASGLAIGKTVGSGTAGSFLYVGTGPVLAQTSNLSTDATGAKLGIGTSPTYYLHVAAGYSVVFGNLSMWSAPEASLTGRGVFATTDMGLYNFNGAVEFHTAANALPVKRAAITPDGTLELAQIASGGTPASNSARIYAKDVAGTAELFVKDEAGNETQISPHAMDGPASFYDGGPTVPYVVKESNQYLGYVRYSNVFRACKLLEDFLKAVKAGKTYAQVQAQIQAVPLAGLDLAYQETFATHNTRLALTGPRAQVQTTWTTEQQKLQDAYDAARAAELATHAAWQAGADAYPALLAAWHAAAAAAAAWKSADVATRGPAPQPPGPQPAGPGPEPAVRPAADVRKPVPAWLAARGVT